MNKTLSKNWLIVQIKPHSEDLAIQNLQRQGFETFLPKIKKTIIKTNKFIDKEVSLFPGYGFVGVDLKNSNWIKINSTYGVSKLLTFNHKPSEVHLDFIIALKQRYEDNFFPKIHEKLKKGDKIKFISGPLIDLVAKIESVHDQKRIYLLFEIIGGYRKLKINLEEKINFIKI